MGQVLGTILARSCTLLRKLTDFQSLLVFWCFRLTLEFAGEFFRNIFSHYSIEAIQGQKRIRTNWAIK